MTLAIILNYPVSGVEYARIPEDAVPVPTTEAVEDYLVGELGYRLDEIAYMLVNDFCPVYDVTEDQVVTGGKPTIILH